MNIITRNTAKRLVVKHRAEIEDKLKELKGIKNSQDRDNAINETSIFFMSRINNNFIGQFNLRFSFDLKKVTLFEGRGYGDSFTFELEEVFPKEKEKPTTTTTTSTTTKKARVVKRVTKTRAKKAETKVDSKTDSKTASKEK